MQEIMRTNDLVVLGLAETLLTEAGLAPHVLDREMSVMEGSIGMFPRRLLVADSAVEEARQLLADAGLATWLVQP